MGGGAAPELEPYYPDSATLHTCPSPLQAFSVTWSNYLPEALGTVTTTVDPKLLIVHIADGQPRVPIPFCSMPCRRVFIPRVPWAWGRRPLIISQFSIHFHPLELFSWVPSVIREREMLGVGIQMLVRWFNSHGEGKKNSGPMVSKTSPGPLDSLILLIFSSSRIT